MAHAAIVDAFALAREAYTSPEVRFLSEKQHGPFILALFTSTFSRGRPAVLDNDFHETVEATLDALRDRGEPGLPNSTGRALSQSWIHDGWLEKDVGVDGRPIYRPSAATQTVLDWLAGQSRRRLVSAPRVNQVFDSVSRLAALADPDREASIREHERLAIMHQREAKRLHDGGDLPRGTDDELVQYAAMVADAMDEIPSDFRRVGQQFSAAQRQIREALLTGDETAGQVMSSVVTAARQITEETPEGRAFKGVADLIRDDATMATLRANVTRIMRSPVADMFTESERVMFANLSSVFVSNVDLVLQGPRALTQIVAGRLAAHVTTTSDKGGIGDALRAARAALLTHKGPIPTRALPTLGPLRVHGSALRLHDPRPVDAPRALADVPPSTSQPLTPEYLRRWGGPHGEQVADHVTRLFTAGRERVTLAEAWAVAPPDLRRSVELIAYLGHPARNPARPFLTEVITVTEGDTHRRFRIPRIEFTRDHHRGDE